MPNNIKTVIVDSGLDTPIPHDFSSIQRWSADWIRFGWREGAPLLRKDFRVEKPIRRAVVHATALGVCEVRLNGRKVGNTHLMPGWTDYRERVYFHSFDVTSQLRDGANTLGGLVAPGWFAGHFGPFCDKGYYGHDAWFSAELDLEYEDGTRESILTDAFWKGTAGPIVEADLLMGETYDARKELPGWDTPDFDDCGWERVRMVEGNETLPREIESYPGEPVRTIAELPAQSVSEPAPGVHVFNLGQNMVGVVRLKIK
ncbi:MAG: alpha-L-rhamnosidase N-terminal domain-containing protein, partial [Verrucomicrobiota bacterium]|nr:alpha-L-rhamnosidase N-terminal domain-containing protein [Verrucomicrobiota bacterium]